MDQLMMRYGMITLFLLAVLPNPLFEFAGITAGATRIRPWRFLLPVAAGKLLRAFLLAFIGSCFLNLVT